MDISRDLFRGEVKEAAAERDVNKIKELSSNLEKESITQNEADDIARRNLENQKTAKEVSFTGTPEMAKRYLDQSYRHMNMARRYEREANNLEMDIRRKKEPQSKMTEVRRLRNKADREKREADQCKRAAERLLRSF